MHLTSQTPERRLLRIRGRARAGSERPISAGRQAYRHEAPSEPSGTADQPSHPETHAERRRSKRIKKRSDVTIRRIGGINLTVQTHDISAGGCRIELLDRYQVGDPAITRLPQLEPLGSRICWVSGTTAGIQFLTTIYTAVFNALLQRLTDLEAA